MTGKLLIFDCDGVLVDSEPISISLMVKYCSKSGLRIGHADAYECFLGKPVADAHEIVNARFGVDMPPIDLHMFQMEIMKAFRAELKPVFGITNALSKISLKKCVASSSNMARIKECLALTRLSRFFEPNLFSTDLVKRGKPHPDVFLYAADMMHTPAVDAIVVEDSPAGIHAAKSAGMKTIAFTGGSHGKIVDLKTKLAHLSPDILINDMADLLDAVSELAMH
jgi:HAD superfamily hydrolase (TIGR01509 family)